MLRLILLLVPIVSCTFECNIDLNSNYIQHTYESPFSNAKKKKIDKAVCLWNTIISNRMDGNLDIKIYNYYEISNVYGYASVINIREINGHTYASLSTIHINLSTQTDMSLLFDTAVHEIGHALGIGTLWVDNGLYIDGSGEYTGIYALEAYQNEYSFRSYIPVELGCGSGCRNSHWDETDMTTEIMTPFIDRENYISRTSIMSLKDLGFQIKENIICHNSSSELDNYCEVVGDKKLETGTIVTICLSVVSVIIIIVIGTLYVNRKRRVYNLDSESFASNDKSTMIA